MSKSTLRRLGRTMRDDDALEFLSDHFPCVANLLRVARAAKVIKLRAGYDSTSRGSPFYIVEPDHLELLAEVLKEVEHLL